MNKKPLITAICIMAILSGMLSGCGTQKNQGAAPTAADKPKISVEPAQPAPAKQKYNFEGKIKMDFIQTPQAMIVYTKEIIDNMDAIKLEVAQMTKKQSEGQALTKEETARIDELQKKANDIILNAKTINDKKLLKEIFDEIHKLEGDKVEITEATNATKTLMFSFLFIDDEDKGLVGNSETDYLRYMAVLKDNYIVVPKVTEDGKQGYYAKVKINDNLLQKLEKLTK